MLSQRYSGDITIVPDISYTDYPVLMSNPTPEFLVEARLRGERATWPSTLLPHNPPLIIELSIIHNHCAIELAIDNALYALNVKMVFGNHTSPHHLRHRSHEPQVNERWNRSPVKRTTSTHTISTLATESTPLDVESPPGSREGLRFLIANHRSTPSTPAEETGVRKRLLSSGPLTGGLSLEGMTFTLLDSGETEEAEEDSPSALVMGGNRALLGETLVDEESALRITPPSTPQYGTPALGSPTLSYRGSVGKDASGTRKMMLKRKSSSLLRQSASQQQMESGLQWGNNGG
jgi:hypothetical protein